jgi:recombination protein RecT
MSNAPRNEVANRDPQALAVDQNVGKIRSLMESQKAQILAALPKHMSPDRMLRIALTELRRVPKLASCDPLSFMGAIVQAAQLGLEPGSGLGHAFLIPFYNSKRGITECNLLAGYRGLIELARRSGRIDSISARCVYAKDKFAFAYGDDEKIIHEPYTGPEERGAVTFAYAIARIKGSSVPQREVMSFSQIDEVRRKHGKGNPVWADHFDEMARKTVVRRLCKYLPQSPELASVIALDDTAEATGQGNWNIIDASYTPEPTAVNPDVRKEALASSDLDALEEAKTEFDLAVEFATSRGGDVPVILGIRDMQEVRSWKDAARFKAAAKMIMEARA